MIVGFADADTRAVFEGRRSKKLPPSINRGAMRKLWILDAAAALSDLRVPPGNRLEKLSGAWSGYYSIRINDQWRIRFIWTGGNSQNVQIIDYH